jgi:Rieske Fe-S protein
MSTGEKKPPATQPTTTSPSAASSTPQPTKQPMLSRRTFLKAAMGASIVLAGASMATSGEILSPLIPAAKGRQLITSATDLETQYAGVKGKTDPNGLPLQATMFFYWPYDPSVSPYYKNILVRLPDELLDPSIQGSTPNLAHYEAWNLTCVHLRCIVNPGYDLATKQYRLQCPCHGSQYRYAECCRTEYLATGSNCVIPVAGPAFDLGLRPLPRVILSLDSNNNIYAERFDGDPGIGRTD